MSISNKILQLSKQLYPKGRAFKMPEFGDLEKLHIALSEVETVAYQDGLSILNAILPDNNNFTSDDATEWEVRLGMIISGASLTDRKLAILRKMNHPGTIKTRQSYLYLEGQLQAAGFNVYVYENRFFDGYDWETKTPQEFSLDPYPNYTVQLNDHQLGDFQLGGIWSNKVANDILESKDDKFDLGNNLRSTFFIGAAYEGEWADVPLIRETEFRQLILKIKPVQTIAFLLVNYT